MNNYWGFALILSLLFHTAILFKLPLNFTKNTKIETQVKKKVKKKEIQMILKKIEKISNYKLKPIKLTEPLPYIENLMEKILNTKVKIYPIEKKSIASPNIGKNMLNAIISNKSLRKSPAYMNYYRLIREKIRLNAYQNYNRRKNGEVTITFLVFKDGSIKGLQLDSNSIRSRRLRKIALKSVEESAPFPDFPAELKKYSHLKFSIPIYFKDN